MRSDEKEIEEKVRKKCSLNGSKTLQNKETKAIESVEWIEPCLNWQSRVSLDKKIKFEKNWHSRVSLEKNRMKIGSSG